MPSNRLGRTLELLRSATKGSEYEGALWIVGGYVRDKLLGIQSDSDDVDIVLEKSAADLAQFLSDRGLAQHAPVTYPRFGTAMVTVEDVAVELVTARRESYAAGSRKPESVQPATIAEDALRRDFTINTLLVNLHTGKLLDPLKKGRHDLKEGIIRTPLPAADTFADDPLRMLRAIRFAARFDFQIHDDIWSAIADKAALLVPTVSGERIRDEFNKILLGNDPVAGLNLLLRTTILDQIAPEITAMVGVSQNEFHIYPVWEHTMAVLGSLIKYVPSASLHLRMATLLHDCGKPSTKTVGPDGRIHFYGHQDVGAKIARTFLQRLKFSNSDIETITSLIALHMRIGEYKPDEWTDAAVRRFIRSAGPLLEYLFELHRADVAGLGLNHQDMTRAKMLRERINELQMVQDSNAMNSPLTGSEIMATVGLPPGPEVGVIKSALTDAVIEGTLDAHDKEGAVGLARKLLNQSVQRS